MRALRKYTWFEIPSCFRGSGVKNMTKSGEIRVGVTVHSTTTNVRQKSLSPECESPILHLSGKKSPVEKC